MLAPYANRPETSGRTYYEPSEFDALIARLDARGFQCFVHATGDRGNRVVLDAFEHARRVNGVRDSRHQIVHVECLDAADVGRFAELGVVACMQPRHCAPEIVAEWRVNVGEHRWRYAWPMRSLVESGAAVAFSSDWNVAEMDPMVGLYTAMTRASLDGRESWVPEERVDVATALRCYTSGGAWANFCDHDRGTLSPGRLADLVMLSNDPFAVEPAALLETTAVMTVVGGEVVHGG
jgi:predicted amidohydrolase YtcJ